MTPLGVATGVAGGLLIAFAVLAAAVALVRAAERLRTWALARWDLDDGDEADRVELAALGAREDADVVAEAERITRDAPDPPPAAGPGRWPTS